VGSGYSIAQLLLNDGDGFCIVRFGTGEEEVVKMQDTTHLVSQPLVRDSCRYTACMPSVSDCMVNPYSHSSIVVVHNAGTSLCDACGRQELPHAVLAHMPVYHICMNDTQAKAYALGQRACHRSL